MKTPIVAIDLGLKRIGLAYSPDAKIVVPLQAIIRKNRNQAAEDVKNVLQKWDAKSVVIGIPEGGDSEDEMHRRIEHFMNLVNFDADIYMQDESESSLEAKELMRGKIRSIRDGRIDSISAMIILERWLATTDLK